MGSNTATVMTLANSIIGVGVLAMPFCFKQCGIILSILMLILSSGLSRLACHFLLKAAIMARRRNFEFLAFHTFGPPGKTLVELFIIGFLMGTCIAFFVVVGDLGPVIIAKLFNIGVTTGLRQFVLIGLAVGIVLPLGLMRNVTSLSTICTATIGFYLCLVLKVMSEATPHIIANDWLSNVHFWRPAGLLQCTPIFSMALFCQTQLFEIYDSLPNATLDKMNYVIRHAVHLCTGFYIFVGFFGYVAFYTQNFTGNILMSFTPSWVSDAIKMGFVLSVAVSFPLVIFPCRASLYSLLFKRASMPHHETTSAHIPETRFRYLTIGIISLSLIVGLITPNIELVLGLVGSTIGVLICVMFPAVAFICISTKSSKERLLAQGLLFVGVLILVLGTYATLYPANEPTEAVGVDSVTYPPDRIDSIARMSLLPVDKAPVAPIETYVKIADKAEPKGNLPENVKDPPAADVNAAVNNPPKVQEVGLPKLAEVDKLDARKEPPIPVEPAADIPVAPSAAVPEKKEEKPELKNLPLHQEEIVPEGKKDKGNGSKVENVLPEPAEEKEKVKSEQVNQDAIKKEEDELAEAEKQAQAEAENKNAELLKKLEQHKEEQKKLLQEQKQILEELKEHKKELDEAAEKKKTDDGPQAVADIKDNAVVKNKSLPQKIGKPRLIDSKIGLNDLITNGGILQNKVKNMGNNLVNEINKPLAENQQNQIVEKKDYLQKPVKSENVDKIREAAAVVPESVRNLNAQESKLVPQSAILANKNKMESEMKIGNPASVQKVERMVDKQQPVNGQPLAKSQKGPVAPLPKLSLPLPLAVRNLTSELYKQQQVVKVEESPVEGVKADLPQAPIDEAKVMRREILADSSNGFKTNISQKASESGKAKQRDILSSIGNDKVYDSAVNDDHIRQKRDAMSEIVPFEKEIVGEGGDKGMTLSKQKDEKDERCDVKDKNEINDNKNSEKTVLDKQDNTNAEKTVEDNQEIVQRKPDSSATEKLEAVSINALISKSADEKNISLNSVKASDPLVPGDSLVSKEDISSNRKPEVNSFTEQEKVKDGPVTLSTLIKMASVLSDPKLSDKQIQHLDETLMKMKDSSIVPKPMARDLKSLPVASQTQEENEHKERNT